MFTWKIGKNKLLNDEKGQAIVEFAFAIPVVVLVIFAIYEFGRLYNIHTLLNGAAQEAVRFATMPDIATDPIPINGNAFYNADYINRKIVAHADDFNLFKDATERDNALLLTPDGCTFLCNGVNVPCTRTLRATDLGAPAEFYTPIQVIIAGEDGLLTNRNGPACIRIDYVPLIGFPLTNSLIDIIDVPPVSISVQATMNNLSEG